MSESNILKKIIVHTEQSQERPLCVFDLDSTLICVSGRTQKILQNIPQLDRLKKVCSSQVESFKNIRVQSRDYSLQQILLRAGVQLSWDCYREVFLYWAFYFFSNEYLPYDSLYTGVQSYLSQLSQAGSDIMYLTGRSRTLMGIGTAQQIKNWNLPFKKPEHLIMKQNTFTEDAYYKKCQLEILSKYYKNIWFFENEPVIINFIDRFLPGIQIVFVDSVHSGRQILRKHFPSISMDYSL